MKKMSKTLGIIIVCSAIIFMAQKIWAHWQALLIVEISPAIVAVVAAGSLAYALSSFLLSFAWRRLLIWFGQVNVTAGACHFIYARTQIGKYIPGNIFHLAGRHVIGMKSGLGHGPLAGAAVYEIAGLLFASSALALTGISVFGMNQVHFSVLTLSAIFSFMLVLPLLLNLAIPLVPGLRSLNFPKRSTVEIFKAFTPTYFLYAFFFLVAGGILCFVTGVVAGMENINQAGLVIMTLALAWIAGFITPGASGGIGIREAIIVVLLTKSYGEPASLLIAIIFRIITLIGDVIFFLSSFIMPVKMSVLRQK